MIQAAMAGEGAASDSDEALVAAAREEPDQFGQIYERYLPGIYRYLVARVGRSDEAADLTQTVFLRAFRSLSSYRPKRAPFSAWLFRIARNAAVDSLRRHRPAVSLDGLADVLVAAPGESPEALAERRERLDHLRGHVASLDSNKRELLILRFAGELTVREIAQVVGKSEAATRKQLTRTINALKEQYDAELQ